MISIQYLTNTTLHELDAKTEEAKQILEQYAQNYPKKQDILFVNCYKPDEDDLVHLSASLGKEIEELRELVNEGVRGRVEEEGNVFLLVYRAPHYEEVDEIVTAPISFFIKGQTVFILSKHKIKSVEQVIKDFQQHKKYFLFKKHPGHFLYYFIDKINDEYITIMNTIANSSELIKEKGESLSKKSIERIDSLNTTLIYFNRALLGNAEVATVLKKSHFAVFRKFHRRDYFTDLYFDALQLLDMEKIQREVITSIFHFQNALSSHRLNIFMKRLTSLALLVMIPTFITGVYGMNFTHIPLQEHPLGFYITTGSMLFMIGVLFYVFKQKKWL